MATTFTLRSAFGATVAAAAVAVAFVLRLQQPLLGENLQSQTYCYQGVRTHDDDQPSANCFSVSSGTFTEVFESQDVSSLNAGFVIPGLWDGHGHLLGYGEFLHSADLFGSSSIDDIRGRLRDYVDAHPDTGYKDDWIRGIGWDQTVYGRMPTAADIEEDDLLKGRFFMLDRIDVHCTWVSQAVLDLLPADLPDVPGGEIVREPGMGVFCDNAMDLVMNIWPKPGAERGRAFVKTAMSRLNQVGLVGIHDAGAFPETVELFTEMAGTDDWTVRVYAMLECAQRNTFCPEHALSAYREDDFLAIKSVKLFADGALGSWGSAMLLPYSDKPTTSGSLLVNASILTAVTKAWSSLGFQVNIHAIGDLANRLAIDAMELALKEACPDEKLSECQARRRFRIEHSQIIHLDDQARMRSIGIIPSIQPTHATSDMKYAELRLGPERIKTEAYRMRSLLDLNPILGSDFPVEPPNPFQGIYAAVARKNPNTGYGTNGSSSGWHTEEALSLDEALLGFTKGAAHGAFMEGRAGVIKKGALADWVVLDKAIESMDIEELRELKVRETWVGGKRVYQREDS